MIELNKTYNEDCLKTMARMPDNFVDCCITSPPYWGLRDYQTEPIIWGDNHCEHEWIEYIFPAKGGKTHPDRPSKMGGNRHMSETDIRGVPQKSNFCNKCNAWKGNLGLEPTPELYVEHLVQIFQEVKRVLKKEGTLWLNLGDSYISTAPNTMGDPILKRGILSGVSNRRAEASKRYRHKTPKGLKPKDMCGIPWRVAFALQADGWYLRSDIIEEVEFYCPCGCGHIMEERIWRYSQDRDIIWKKPNPMPESVTDRPTKAHEYIFLMTKSGRYYYDADAIRDKANPNTKYKPPEPDGKKAILNRDIGGFQDKGFTPNGFANKKTVWTVTTQPLKEAHFATYPEKFIEPCVLAGCPKDVCSKCGKAVERIVEKGELINPKNSKIDENKRDIRDKGWNAEKGFGKDCYYKIKIIGFKPSCNCNAGTVPGVIYDPFMGAGTTAKVALRALRNFIGSEINPKYLPMINNRIKPLLDQWNLFYQVGGIKGNEL